MTMRRMIAHCLLASLLACAPSKHIVYATPDASEHVLLTADHDAVFLVDGKEVGRGTHLEVMVSSEHHAFSAKAEGYKLKTDHLEPPYSAHAQVPFYFLIEDQEQYQPGAAPPRAAAPVLGSRVGEASPPLDPSRSGPLAQAPAPQPAATPVEVASSVAPPPVEKGPVRVWTFVIGISKFKDESIALRYADRDAQAIDRFFASDAGGSVPDSRRTLLMNEQATRAAILSSLINTAKRAAPNDLIVLYLAMHGLPDSGGDLYFIAHDTDVRSLVGTGLPQRDVEYALASSPARRVVMLLDACHAGAAGFGGFQSKRGIVLAETNRLLQRLADSKPGIAVLTASSASEPSNEGEQWGGGHGTFTHYLLVGLSGRADADHDGIVSIRELYDFVYQRVSEDTQGSQHPELKGNFDNALPIAQPK
jgi:hypothetical protein